MLYDKEEMRRVPAESGRGGRAMGVGRGRSLLKNELRKYGLLFGFQAQELQLLLAKGNYESIEQTYCF